MFQQSAFLSTPSVPTRVNAFGGVCLTQRRISVLNEQRRISRTGKHREKRTFPKAHLPNRPPNYADGFDPSSDGGYDEARVYSFSTARDGCSILTLRPVSGGPLAFKMSVTAPQADAIRRALSNPSTRRKLQRHTRRSVDGVNEDGPSSLFEGSRTAENKQPTIPGERPSTHDLLKTAIDACGGVVAQAAITHIRSDVFIARLWLRTSAGMTHIDARPSDALVLAIRTAAPLFLNRGLLQQWGVSVSAVSDEAKQGLCSMVQYDEGIKSARSLFEETKRRPEFLKLAHLKSRLDLAVRLERFAEAGQVYDELQKICPIEDLQKQLAIAVSEERFMDAVKLQDEITIWRARLRMWEKGEINLEELA